MPDTFWAEGVATAVHILNLSPTKAVWNETPYEAWSGNKPSKSQENDTVHQVEMEEEQSTLETTQQENGDYDRSNTSTQEKSKSAPLSEVCSPNEASSSSTTQLRRSERGYVPRRRFPIEGEDTSSFVMFAGDPISVNEAMAKEEWRVAMQERVISNTKESNMRMEVFKSIKQGWSLGAPHNNKESIMKRHSLRTEPNKVLRLRKALYGLKQAPRAWYSKIDDFFHKNDFEKSQHEPTLYIKRRGTDHILIVSLYVDDMIYTGSSLQLIQEFQTTMKKMFDMTDLGELQYFLGLEITQTQEGIFMFQKKYVADTLKKFNTQGCKIFSTPMNTNEKLRFEDDTEAADVSVYRSLVGRLIYLTHSHPDISYVVGVLSRFMHRPTKHHFGAMKRVLHYLAGTQDYGIWFSKTKDFRLKGYTDSDWAGSVDDMRSTSGNCFTLKIAVIAWSSKKQASVALSSIEVEYVAAAAAASCQAVWLR
nr:retrovirus-related Pol polyprotein from transposon TNT 1-94 [Tanacetum cinerariifolium]